MAVKNIQIYGVNTSQKMHLQVKKFKVEFFINPRRNVLSSSYH